MKIFNRKNKKPGIKCSKKKAVPPLPFLEQKAAAFKKYRFNWQKKRWYKKHRKFLCFKLSIRKKIHFLEKLHLPGKILDTIRWVMIDFLRGKTGRFWGIYQFVALPGEGKTISMVHHMERAINEMGESNIYIATNFTYKHQNAAINHWTDIITAAKYAHKKKLKCILAIDEIHTTFDASDWKSFPAEMLALLSFNRKYGLQFLCSSQIYERIPKKVRDIANYTVICKNTLGLDRHFKNYYFTKADYDSRFDGKKKHAEYIVTFVASDYIYSLYDTLAQVDKMTADAMTEQSRKKEAFDLLFGSEEDAEPDEIPSEARNSPAPSSKR